MNDRAARQSQAVRQLGRAAIAIYATLSIGTFLVPVSVSDWVEQLEWQQARAILLPVADSIVRVSKYSGAVGLYLAWREHFLSMTSRKERDV